jgi:hypothetical protein
MLRRLDDVLGSHVCGHPKALAQAVIFLVG